MSEASQTMIREMPLLDLMMRWRVGSGDWSWDEEFHWLRMNHQERLDVLASSIQETGMHDPIQLGSNGRVWGGHHRICVAFFLAIPSVPVEMPASPRSALGANLMTADEPVEAPYCVIHSVEEPDLPGDFKACGECWHVFRTEAELLDVYARWVRPRPTVFDPQVLLSCPYCTHDW